VVLERLEDRTLPSSYSAASVSGLIADINAANKAGGGNTITLTANTTFDLTKVNANIDGPTGLPVIAAGDALTITGQGGDIIQRDPSASAFRLFAVASGASLTLGSMTLQNGLALGSGISAEGGAVYSQGNLVLNSMTVQDSEALGSPGTTGTRSNPNGGTGQDAAGGALYVAGGSASINSVTLTRNKALGGSGGKPYASNYNGGNGGNGFGGGLYLAGGTVTVENGTLIQQNSAAGGAGYSGHYLGGNGLGGGLYLATGTLTVETGTVIHNNSAVGGSGFVGGNAFGGGLYLATGTLTVETGTLIDNNSAAGGSGLSGGNGFGGGLYAAGGSTAFSNATVEFNAATGGYGSNPGTSSGGGLFFASAAVYSIDPTTVVIADNTAQSDPDANPPTTFFVLSGLPSTTTAGQAQSFTLTVNSDFGQVVTDTAYTGTVHFTSVDSQAVLPADYTFKAADHGVQTFSVTFKTATAYTWPPGASITATDTANAAVTASEATGVYPLAASSINLASGAWLSNYEPRNNPNPSSLTPGGTGDFIFEAYDSYGNFAAPGETFNITSSDPAAVFPSQVSSDDYGGVEVYATFATVGAQTLTVTDAANPSITITIGVTVEFTAPWAAINGPSQPVAVANQPLTFTLTAGGGLMPPGANVSFAVNWGDGTPVQTVIGPSGTTVTHVFTVALGNSVGIESTATYDGLTIPGPYFLTVTFAATVESDPANPSQYALLFYGTGGLSLSPGANNGVAVFDNSSSVTINAPGDVRFAHIIMTGVSDISLTGGLAVPALITGYHTLDASGGVANNILIGLAGNVTLKGGGGRDILIADPGACTLDAGSGDDILIGGDTAYDSNIPALLSIMAEWGRTDADYATRVGQLLGTESGGLNGSYLLNTSTVSENGASDILNGGAGMDWFFADNSTSKKDTTKDTINNQTTGEVVTSI
jgi:hypothetical protein